MQAQIQSLFLYSSEKYQISLNIAYKNAGRGIYIYVTIIIIKLTILLLFGQIVINSVIIDAITNFSWLNKASIHFDLGQRI